jgi:hypothetical protein
VRCSSSKRKTGACGATLLTSADRWVGRLTTPRRSASARCACDTTKRSAPGISVEAGSGSVVTGAGGGGSDCGCCRGGDTSRRLWCVGEDADGSDDGAGWPTPYRAGIGG